MRFGLLGVATAFLVATFGGRADADIVIDVYQSGNNVVATGGGTIDLTDLVYKFSGTTNANVEPSAGIITLGVGGFAEYSGLTGPTNFGPGAGPPDNASSGSGDLFGPIGANGRLLVPSAYISLSALSATDTWNNTTLAALGLKVGTYEWTWGTGAHADSLTLNIGAVAAPEPSTLPAWSIAGLAGLVTWIRRRPASTI